MPASADSAPQSAWHYFWHQSEFGRDRAAHADHTGKAMSGSQPVALAGLWCTRPRPEIPDIGAVIAGQQTEPAHIVRSPFRPILVAEKNITDVVHIEHSSVPRGRQQGLRSFRAKR